jgi:hypothetical protein
VLHVQGTIDLGFELGLKILEFEKMCWNQNQFFKKWNRLLGANSYLKNLQMNFIISKPRSKVHNIGKNPNVFLVASKYYKYVVGKLHQV